MSKKAMAAFTLAITGAGILPGAAAVAHADADVNAVNLWQVPAVSAIDAHNADAKAEGGKYDVTVETRESVDAAWEKVALSDGEKDGETDSVALAQKALGSPSEVAAEGEKESLTRITYTEKSTPAGFEANKDSLTLYKVADGWVQAETADDSAAKMSDEIKYTAAVDSEDDSKDEAAKVEFLNEVTKKDRAEATASPSPTPSESKESNAGEKPSSSNAASATATSAPVAKAEESAPGATSSSKAVAPTSSSPKVNTSIPSASSSSAKVMALPVTGMKAAPSSGFLIEGTVFVDGNGNGNFDSNESGAGKRTVYLKNALDQSVVAMRTTDASGQYSFEGIQMGTYEVTVASAGDSAVTSVWGNSQARKATVVLNNQMTQKTVDFGVSGGSSTSGDSNSPSNQGGAAPSAPSLDNSTSSTTPSDSDTVTEERTSTSVVTEPSGDSTTIDSGAVPNSVNGASLGAGAGLLALAGGLFKVSLGRRRK